MTIKQYKPGLPIEVGQWVTLDSFMRGSIAGYPALVVGITGKSIRVSVLESWRRENEMAPPTVKRIKSVTFVCDTKEEAIKVREAAVDDADMQWKIERERNKEDAARRAAVVAKLVEGGAA